MKHIRSALSAAVVGSAAAFSVAAAGMGQVAPVAQTAQPAPALVAAPAAQTVAAPTTTAVPALKPAAKHRSATPKPTASSTKTTTTKAPKHRSSSTSSAGCGQRAVTAGVFNPSCSEYQGYLDPGLAGGRAPSSGDIQSAWMDCTATKSDAECRKELN